MEKQDFPVFFGEWVKCRRIALDMTQSELAMRAGCSIGTLRKIESGERKPSKQLSGLLANALEIPAEHLQTFIRVSRGELPLERLSQLGLGGLDSFSGGIPPRRLLPSMVSRGRLSRPVSRIPFQATPMIGREFEYSALERLFNDSQCRLLTLTGVGGIGKTCLALEYANRKQSAFPGGIFYFPLSSVTSPGKVIFTVADVLDYAFSGPLEPKEQLFHYISTVLQQRSLFIFDNLEHLLCQDSEDEVEFGLVDLIREILQRFPRISILGTSRERLNIHGEWIYELLGLSVPPAIYTGNLEQFESVALFINSARRIKPDFQLSLDDQPFIVRICQLVEGVPLAIELAAAWVGILSCHEIAQEIQSSMDFLTTSLRDIPERHRSLRATFDHSWKLLSDEERRALSQLSVFYGGFDRIAAVQVVGASLSLLASLFNKSLIHHIESDRSNLHEVIRQYAMSHLCEQPDYLDTYERYCEYYLELAAAQQKLLRSASQQVAVRQLTKEIDNIRSAWEWAIEHRKFAHLLQASRAFGWYFEIVGQYREGIEQLELLLRSLEDVPKGDTWYRLYGLALILQGLLYFRKGEFDHARKLYEDGVLFLRPVDDQASLAEVLVFLGIIMHLRGDYKQSKLYLEEGRNFAQNCKDPWFVAYANYNLGYVDSLMGNYSEGYAQMESGLAAWREIGDPQYIALGLNFLVPTLIKLRKYHEAKKYMHESITLCEQTKNRWGMGTAYGYLGLVCMAEGHYDEAKMNLLTSLETFRGFITGWNIALSLTYLGHANRLAGDYIGARNIYTEVFQLSVETEAVPILLDAISGISFVLKENGQLVNALVSAYFVQGHPSSEEETKIRASELCASLEQELTPHQIELARYTASNIKFEEIVALVVNSG